MASCLVCLLVETGMVDGLGGCYWERCATNLVGDTLGDQVQICWLVLVDWRFDDGSGDVE